MVFVRREGTVKLFDAEQSLGIGVFEDIRAIAAVSVDRVNSGAIW